MRLLAKCGETFRLSPQNRKFEEHFRQLQYTCPQNVMRMTQICANLDPDLYDVLLEMAEEADKPKGKVAAELIEYGINRPDAAYTDRLEKELEMKDELIKQMREELGFLRSSYATLETQIAAPLTRLLPEVTETRRHWWDRFRRKKEEDKK